MRVTNYTKNNFSIDFINFRELNGDIKKKWEKFIQRSNNLDVLFQSFEWCNHLYSIYKENDLFVVIIKNDVQDIVGLIPIYIKEQTLKYEVASYALFKVKLQTVVILGNDLILKENINLYNFVFKSIIEYFDNKRSIYIDSVKKNSYLWDYLQNSKKRNDKYVYFFPYGTRPYHYLNLPKSFDSYLARFNSKKRNKIKRSINILEKNCSDGFKVYRIDSQEKIDFFLEKASEVEKFTWQQRKIGEKLRNDYKNKNVFIDLAERKLLYSYILICSETPLAFVVGYRYKDIFYYMNIGFHSEYKKYSPGIILLISIIQDLIKKNKFSKINFGIGTAKYKKSFCDIHTEDSSIYIMTKSFKNNMLILSHNLFFKILIFAKKIYLKYFK